ncbi:hypothetical protein BJ875DRAFT_469645 [Amylocarpus encephaloides]|uniref:Uncharacterized protein n=1 Tax=Amylocarpus encephaloides TaxID=45428 RepID=A0A9P8C2T0_9HELO|nr:hypothetical protein BJ875DRAFT_469645 [Amylocarpus encephaloides]
MWVWFFVLILWCGSIILGILIQTFIHSFSSAPGSTAFERLHDRLRSFTLGMLHLICNIKAALCWATRDDKVSPHSVGRFNFQERRLVQRRISFYGS